MVIEDEKDLAAMLALQLESRELSQRELARDIGVSNQTVANIINGKGKMVGLGTVLAILKRFGMYLVAKEDIIR